MAGRAIGLVALLVRDYEEGKSWFCDKLGFVVLQDQQVSNEKRWLVVSPKSGYGTGLLLAKAANPKQQERVGDQTGGRVFLFLQTDNFWRDYRDMQKKGVQFCEDPRNESYGTVAVFEDLYGNRWDLLELKTGSITT